LRRKRCRLKIGQLTALETLDLDACSALKELPAEVGQLISLESSRLPEYLHWKEGLHPPTHCKQASKHDTVVAR